MDLAAARSIDGKQNQEGELEGKEINGKGKGEEKWQYCEIRGKSP